MSVKETIHKWVDSFPDDSPGLRELYEEARLDLAIDEAKKSLAEGRYYTLEQVKEMMDEKWARRRSA
ncbi:MAG TPA: hypothetical protein VEO95_12255 [Chthoniobacteraceae bacterium]|nr:hypothetical protein [Chthoniobacteraceae bacterium]